MKSKIFSLLLLLPILLIGAGLIVPSFIDWNKYKPKIIKKIKDSSGFDVTFAGDISLVVFPLPKLSISDVSVKNNDKMLAKLETLKVSVEFIPLLSKQIKVSEIALIRPVIDVLIDKAGKGSWENGLSKTAKNEASEKSESTKKASIINEFSINDLIIKDGVLNFADARSGAKHKVEQANINAEIKSLTGPFNGEVSFKYNGKTYDISGTVASIEEMTAIPMDVALALDGNDVKAAFKGVLNGVETSLIGDVSVTGADISKYASSAKGPFSASGKVAYSKDNIKLDDFKASLSGLKFVGDISNKEKSFSLNIKETSGGSGNGLIGAILSGAKINADIVMKENSVEFPAYDLVIRGASYKGSGAYKFDNGVDLSLTASKVNVDEWLKLAGIESKSTNGASKNSGGASKSKELGFSIPMKASVKANIVALTYEGKTYRDVVVNINTGVNSLKINKLSLKTSHGTEFVLKGKIANTSKLSGLDLKTSFKTSDADALLKSYAVDRSSYKETIGAISLDGAISGSIDNLGFSSKTKYRGLTLSASGQVKDPMGILALSGLNIRAQHANMVNAIKIAQPGFSMDRAWQKPLDLSVSLNKTGNTINITSIKGKAGLLPIDSGNLVVKTGAKIPSVSGALAFGRIIFPEATQSSSKGKSASSGRSSKSTKWSNDPIDTSWMSLFTADLDIKAKKIVQNKWIFDNASLDFDVSDGALTISELKANMFNGSAFISGKVVAGQGGKGFSSVEFTTETKNLNAKTLYSAIKGKNSDMISGAITNASEKISTHGATLASLVSNLSGKANINGERIVIKGVDVTSFARAINGDFRGLNSLKDISSNVLFKGKTEFTTMNGNFDIAQGIVNFNPVTLDGKKAVFDITGSLDLPKWWIDINNKVQVKGDAGEEIPPFDMSFRGSLDNPIKSAGGTALESLAKNKLGKLLGNSDLTNKITDKLGLDKLGIDLFGGSKQQQTEPAAGEEGTSTDATEPVQEQPQQPTAEDAINDAIGGFLRGL